MKFSLTWVWIVALGIALGCKKEGNGPHVAQCALPDYKAVSQGDFGRPCGIAVSKSGMVAVNAYNGFGEYGGAYGILGKTRVWRNYSDFLAKAAPVAEWDNRGAEALAFDSDDNLYVAETEQVAGIAVYRKQVFTISGRPDVVTYHYVKTIQGGFVNPRGLAFDSQDRLYIANDGVGNIIRMNSPLTSDVKQPIASGFGNVKGLAIYQDTLYTTTFGEDVVMKHTLNGDGSYGTIVGIARGIANPVDIAVTDGVLVISSPVSGMVTLLNPQGFNGPSVSYDDCVKEIAVGRNLFGLAFVPTPSNGVGLLAAHLDQNKVIFYQP
ncbi:hypothetical protein FAZ15_06820 [Sphingobacterium olei]|uniref:SMP-30/Gluconolactonase/LRE-like region domain-containing protein n=1 Tax=Sphingobacterium olei TaxID=2571155 RepID=A0A4U0P4G3_9SPHI|nr:hypothetical protein [Sphingobacterium olei]TJZ62213.1 hypothetical protein FAZ15_06820 [Sphingobacterium olei]